MRTLDFEDFFEAGLNVSLNATTKKIPVPKTKKPVLKVKASVKPAIKSVTKPKLATKIKLSDALKSAPKTSYDNIAKLNPTAIAKALEAKKKASVAQKAKATAVVASKKAALIKKTEPAKAKILAAKAVTLSNTADKLQLAAKIKLSDALKSAPKTSYDNIAKLNPTAIAKALEAKKKASVAQKAKATAVVASKKAALIKKTEPAKAKILAAKAVTLSNTADKLQRTVNVDAQRATPLPSTSPVKASELKTVTTVIKQQLEQLPSTPKNEAKIAKLEVIEDKLNKEIAVQAAPIVSVSNGGSLNENVIQKLDALEKQILTEQDSKFRRRVLGKLDSLQRRVASSGLATRAVYA